MKTRNGFVSNSSSSSFVVEKMNRLDMKAGARITPAQEKALLKFGFRKTYVYSPYLVPFTGEGWKDLEKKFKKISEKKPTQKEYAQYKKMRMSKTAVDRMNNRLRRSYTLCYSVACNEDEVIRFLIKNKIPFEANTHYDQYTYLYFPDKDRLVIAVNFGNMVSMYKSDIDAYANGKTGEKAVKVITGEQYLKDTSWCESSE